MGIEKSRIISQGAGGDTKVVVDYTPKKFPVEMAKPANDFQSSQKGSNSDFEINNLVAELTGIADKRRAEIEERIEALTLEKLKTVEEKAYNEAYDLGLIEGTEKAFQEKTAEIEKRLGDLDLLMNQIQHLTINLLAEKENQIMKMINKLASKIAMFEIEQNQENLIRLIYEMFEEMQDDEKVLIRVAPSDAEFIKQTRTKLGTENNVLKTLKIEVDHDLLPGGCVMESNYGSIDASIEMRVSRAWKAIEERLPRVSEDRIELDEEKYSTVEEEPVKAEASVDEGNDKEPEVNSETEENKIDDNSDEDGEKE